ncbi:MAG TPA: response regulator [Chloroflexia bacterium]|nr:response regulator [Chloroflexia bacterium]
MFREKPFILLVEDDGPLRKVLARYLQATGYMVLQASSFREAVDSMAIKPAIVILDINLPDATGWDVAEWLRSLSQDVPVLMMSAYPRPGAKQLNKVGARAFLAKPFPVAELLRLVQQYVPLSH